MLAGANAVVFDDEGTWCADGAMMTDNNIKLLSHGDEVSDDLKTHTTQLLSSVLFAARSIVAGGSTTGLLYFDPRILPHNRSRSAQIWFG